jgi:hypothetical protein
MDHPGKDTASYLLRFVGFHVGRSLCKTNRFWREQCDAKLLWKQWFQEMFGQFDHPDLDHGSLLGLEGWKEYFINFWNQRRLARQAVKLPERFEPYFYYRRPNKPRVFVKGYCDSIWTETGDIILVPELISTTNFEHPNWVVTFYENRIGTLIPDYNISMKGSTPHQLWFPKIPFDYYHDLLLPNIVHIRMRPEDRDKLVFTLSESGHIDWYNDPRLSGKIYVETIGGPATIEQFDHFITKDVLHANLCEANEDSYFLTLLGVPN